MQKNSEDQANEVPALRRVRRRAKASPDELLATLSDNLRALSKEEELRKAAGQAFQRRVRARANVSRGAHSLRVLARQSGESARLYLEGRQRHAGAVEDLRAKRRRPAA